MRAKLLKWLKGIAEHNIDDRDLRKLIERPLGVLDRAENLHSFDCIVYPISDRSELARFIVGIAGEYIGDKTKGASFELVKRSPREVLFDWEQFDREFSGSERQYKQIKKHVDEVMIPQIHSLEYFSIAESVRTKYRKYMRGFLRFGSEEKERTYAALHGKKILVLDDINTTQSTINEILRAIKTINNDNDIYIFTLLGKE